MNSTTRCVFIRYTVSVSTNIQRLAGNRRSEERVRSCRRRSVLTPTNGFDTQPCPSLVITSNECSAGGTPVHREATHAQHHHRWPRARRAQEPARGGRRAFRRSLSTRCSNCACSSTRSHRREYLCLLPHPDGERVGDARSLYGLRSLRGSFVRGRNARVCVSGSEGISCVRKVLCTRLQTRARVRSIKGLGF